MRKGQRQTLESRKKMSTSHKGFVPSQKTRELWSRQRKGKQKANRPRRIIDNGYARLYKPQHPMSDKSGYILEHRFVVCEALGRTLTSDEIVHHLDEDKLNNAIENLKVINRHDHLEIHFKPKEHAEKIKKIRKERFWSTKPKKIYVS